MLTARLFMRGKPIKLYSRFDEAIDWPGSRCALEDYQRDPVGQRPLLHLVKEPVEFWFRPPALEDVAAVEGDVAILNPDGGEWGDVQKAAYARATRELVRRCWDHAVVPAWRGDDFGLDPDSLIESLGVVAEELGGYLLALLGPSEQEKKD